MTGIEHSTSGPEKLRVLHIIETLGPAGAEQVLVNVLPELSKLGVHCEVAALWPPYNLAAPLEDSGIKVHRLGIKFRWNAFHSIPALRRIAFTSKIDVFHSHLFFSMFHSAISRPLLPNVSSVLTFHNETFAGYPADTAWKRIRRTGEAWLTRHSFDQLTAVSEPVADHYAEQLNLLRTKIRYIPNGFPVEKIQPDPNLDFTALRSRYEIPPAAFLIVSPARLIEQKGHRYLLEAIRHLRGHGIAPWVRIIGRGNLQHELLNLIQQNELSPQVDVLPSMPQSELFPLIQSADLVVLPSVFEGFGLSQCECMLLERPVVGTRVGGFFSTIVDGVSGILVPPRDSVALADAIAELISDPTKRREMGLAARQHIIREFRAERVAADYLRVYESVARARGRSKTKRGLITSA